jgi:F0F1-type ATP synthase membrane subunit a
MGAIEHPPIFSLPGVPDHVTYTWLVMIILVAVSWAATRRVALVPTGVQNFMEVVLEQFNGMIDDVIGHDGRRYLPLIVTMGLFILLGNLMSLVPGLERPTGNLNTTAACALVVFFAYHYIGIKSRGRRATLATSWVRWSGWPRSWCPSRSSAIWPGLCPSPCVCSAT